jgi:CRP/FNR family cyclic AMP-dependent transcriptional regulator
MKRILLVDDNEAIRENTTELLELEHYQVITACNGKEGFDLALSESPDLIICDIMMPVVDGYHLLEYLRNEASLKHIPFIFFTASAEKSEIKKGFDMGAAGYIVKPFDADDLLNEISHILHK